MLLIGPLQDLRSGKAFRRMSAVSPELQAGYVVFIDVANNPNVGKIGNREWIGGKTLNGRGVGDFLVGNHARNRGEDIDNSGGIIGIVAEQPKMLGGGFEGDLGVVFGVLRDFEILLAMAPCS